jgi:hypothetical protein
MILVAVNGEPVRCAKRRQGPCAYFQLQARAVRAPPSGTTPATTAQPRTGQRASRFSGASRSAATHTVCDGLSSWTNNMHVPVVIRQGRRRYHGHRLHCWDQRMPRQHAVREDQHVRRLRRRCGGASGLARYKERHLHRMMFDDDQGVTPQRLLLNANTISSPTRARRPPRARPRKWPDPTSCMRMCIIHVAKPCAQTLLVWSHLSFVSY